MQHITREQIRANYPLVLYVYADDYTEAANRGQAEECSGEPNAIPMFTREWCCKTPEAQVRDSDSFWHNLIDQQCMLITHYLAQHPGSHIYILPKIGRGCSEMHKHAPKTFAYMIANLQQFDPTYA